MPIPMKINRSRLNIIPFSEMTPEQKIAQHYKGCMGSVKLIKAGQPDWMDDDEWADCLARNKAYLKLMLAKDFWTTEDLDPIRKAAQ